MLHETGQTGCRLIFCTLEGEEEEPTARPLRLSS